MSTQQKQSILLIKDKQTIISRLEKREKGTNLALEFKIGKQHIKDVQRGDPEIHQQHRDEQRIENT